MREGRLPTIYIMPDVYFVSGQKMSVRTDIWENRLKTSNASKPKVGLYNGIWNFNSFPY